MDNASKPHVLFLSYHFPTNDEPGAFRPWMEARLLAQAGFRLTVMTSGVHYMTGEDIRPDRAWCHEEWIDDIRILRTWAPKKYRFSLWKRALNYLSYTLLTGFASIFKVGTVDRVLAGTDPIIILPMVLLVSFIKRAPLILDERDLYPETAIALGVIKEGILTRILFALQQFLRRKARNILAATPGIRNKLITYGFSPIKVHLLYNADTFLDEDVSLEQENRLRATTGKKYFVAYAGGLGLANDIPTLLRAAEYLVDLVDLGIIIIGDGENRHSYEHYCQQHYLDNVFFLGAQPRREVRKLLQEIDVGIQPLFPHDYFANTLTSKTFDYLGLAKPVVFCGKGDTVKLLEDSGGGIAVTSGDDRALAQAIRQLHDDEELRCKMGTSARKWFSQHICVDKACSTIKKVMG